MSTNDSKKIILKTSDEQTFEVDEAVAVQSQTIKHIIEDDCADNGIPLPNVTGKILAKVIEYCKKYAVDATKPDYNNNNNNSSTTTCVDEEQKKWDADFVKDLKYDQETLFDLILAANYLDIKGLLDLTCRAVADMIRGKTTEDIRKTLHIQNDYTPEQEEEVRKENSWAFE